MTDSADKNSCPGNPDRSDSAIEQDRQQEALQRNLSRIKHKVLVLSGKGGVGKSTVAAGIAISLAHTGKRVGLMDVDVHGPSIPKLLGIEDARIGMVGKLMKPVPVGENLSVMSIGFLLKSADEPVIWRGPMKMHLIQQFLSEVDWGELDYLIVDSPPGTGDEPLSVVQLLGNADGAVMVTTPQELALNDVRRCVGFCRQLKLPVLGIVQNMNGLVCPHCGETIDVFKRDGGEELARQMQVPFMTSIPMDPSLVDACDAGRLHEVIADDGPAGVALRKITEVLLALDSPGDPDSESASRSETNQSKEEHTLKIAIPLVEGALSMHFGHCAEFALIEVDKDSKQVTSSVTLKPPAHEPGVLPKWLSEQGASVIIASGMGTRAQQLFTEAGIEVVIGAPVEKPDVIVKAYLDGTLNAGENICDH